MISKYRSSGRSRLPRSRFWRISPWQTSAVLSARWREERRFSREARRAEARAKRQSPRRPASRTRAGRRRVPEKRWEWATISATIGWEVAQVSRRTDSTARISSPTGARTSESLAAGAVDRFMAQGGRGYPESGGEDQHGALRLPDDAVRGAPVQEMGEAAPAALGQDDEVRLPRLRLGDDDLRGEAEDPLDGGLRPLQPRPGQQAVHHRLGVGVHAGEDLLLLQPVEVVDVLDRADVEHVEEEEPRPGPPGDVGRGAH